MSYQTIQPLDIEFMQKNDTIIFDVRDGNSYAQQHLANAIPISDEAIMELRSNKQYDQNLIIYCYHGHSSKDICDFLSGMGFNNVYNVEGGWANIKLQLNL